MTGKGSVKLRALQAAFPHTVPILTGFLFLGMTYGVYVASLGFSWVYPTLMAMTIYAGSMEFVTANMLLGAFNPLQAFVMTLMVNARHLFYGLAMLDRFRGLGWKKLYLIFGMCDETFSVTCSTRAPEGGDEGWFMTFVTLLDQLYWVMGAALGGLCGSLLTLNTEGLDFVMTAMFVVIFLDNWLKEKSHASSHLGLALPCACLVLFGAQHFILPSMAAILLALTALRVRLEKGGAPA